MGDPILDRAKASTSAPETARLERPLKQADAIMSRAVATGKKKATEALRAGGNLVGDVARFAGSVLSTPKAALIHKIAGTKTPVTFSPTADVEQFREIAQGMGTKVPPELMSLATDFPLAAGMNAIGRYGVLPIARAIGEPLRRAPVAKEVAEFVKTGSSLPKQYRGGAQDILRQAEGEASLAQAAREKALGPYLKLSQAEQDAVQEAIERRAVETLPDQLKPAAEALRGEYGQRVAARSAYGGRPHELGAHLKNTPQTLKLPKGNIMVQRYEEPGVPMGSPSKPHGLYFSPADVKSPHSDLGGERHLSVFAPDRPLDVSGELRVAHNRFGRGNSGAVSSGIKALKFLSPKDDFNTLIMMNKSEAVSYAERLFPGKDFSRYYDSYEVLEAIGAERARAAGYDAIIDVDKFLPEFTEYVALKDNVLKPVPSQKNLAESLPAFTDRPMTKEMRREAGIQGYGDARALGTGGLKYRTETGRAMTTPEINAMLEGQGKQRLDPVFKAAMDMGQANDSRVMKLRIVNDLTKRFGVPTTNRGEAVIRHEGVGAGITKSQKAFLSNRKLPPEVDELVARLNKRLQPEEYGTFLRASKAINDNFKKWAVFSPGFTSRNWQNNIFQVAMFEDIGPKELALIRQVAKPSPAIVSEAIGMGVIGGGQTAQEITGKMGPIFRGAKAVNQYGEDKARLWLYLIRREKGDTPLKAAARVDDILFNYSSRLASPMRRKIGRHYVPFVNWSTFIPGLAVRAAMERPGSVALAGNIRERQNRRLGYDDERLSEEFGPWNVEEGATAIGEGKAMIPQFAGQYSVNELVPTDLADAANKLAEKIYPQYGVPMGLAMRRVPFKDQSFWYDEKTRQHERFATAPSVLRTVFLVPGGSEFAKAHGISIDPDTKKVVAPARLSYVLGKFPQARLANIVADWIAGVKGKEATLQSFGAGVRTIDRYEPKRRSPGARQ